MKHNLMLISALMTVMLILATASHAMGGWQLEIRAKVQRAETRLVIGQDAGATDGLDGAFDVPAFLGGEIMAHIALDSGQFWKDIRALCEAGCKKTWHITVEATAQKETVTLSWEPASAPQGLWLVDETTGKAIEMRATGSYSYLNAGARGFTVEVRS